MPDRLPDASDIERWKKESWKRLEEYGIASPAALGGLAVATLSTTTLLVWAVRARFKRYPNSDAVPIGALNSRKWVRGVVTSVGDGDNFRFYHTPGPFWRFPFKFRRIPDTVKELKDQTIHIRMAGVDAPEAAHFGKPGQPYAEEARQWLESKILRRTLLCQLVFRDQYKRIVAVPRVPLPLVPTSLYKGRNLSLMMIKAGWGVTYTQSNAEYGAADVATFQSAEEKAKKARRGMWKSGKALESPSDFKQRTKQEPSLAPAKRSMSTRSTRKK